jgi:hypothetical protein
MNQTTGDPGAGRVVDRETQRQRAKAFRDRHVDQADGPLVLPNSWDAASTIIYESMGFEAVGTSSAGIAATQGVPDGEHLDRTEMLDVVERIAGSVQIPVSADIEAGYGDTPAAVADPVPATPNIRPISRAPGRKAAVRPFGTRSPIHLVIFSVVCARFGQQRQ